MENFTDIMVDIETFGTDSDAAMVSIGAVKFNPHTLDTYDSIVSEPERCFTGYFNPQEVLDAGMTVTGKTLFWWLDQSPDARKALTGNVARQQKATSLLLQLSSFCGGSKGLWGNASVFDNVIVRNTYRKFGVPFTLPYQADKCYRTVINLIPKGKRPEFIRYGIHHEPLSDAITQAIHLQKCYEVLGLNG